MWESTLLYKFIEIHQIMLARSRNHTHLGTLLLLKIIFYFCNFVLRGKEIRRCFYYEKIKLLLDNYRNPSNQVEKTTEMYPFRGCIMLKTFFWILFWKSKEKWSDFIVRKHDHFLIITRVHPSSWQDSESYSFRNSIFSQNDFFLFLFLGKKSKILLLWTNIPLFE